MAMDFVYFGVAVVAVLLLKRIGTLLYGQGSSLPLPPGPSQIPLIGNAHQIPKGQPWLYFHDLSKQYGPVVYLNMAGQSVIITSSLNATQALLSKRGGQYSERPRMVVAGELATKGLHMLLRPYDTAYRQHQKLEAKVLNIRAAINYRTLQDLEAKQLLFDLLTSCDSAGEKGVDFNRWFERMTASNIYALLYGYRLRTGLEQELVHAKYVQTEAVKKIQMGANLADLYPALNYLPAVLAPWKSEAEALWQLEINLHMGNMKRGFASPGWNFTKHMKASKEAEDMSPEELAFDLGILADAALDTSTMTLDWLIVAWLTEDKAFVTRAQRFLDEVVGRDRLPQFEDQSQLPYITAIVHETMRWRPAVPGGVPHRYGGKTDDEYNGYRIPSGSIVLGNHWSIARDESVYGHNTDAFIPERWLIGKDSDTGHKLNDGIKDMYDPGFGFGRRVCTGQHIARNMLFITIARLLWAFDVEPAVTDRGERLTIDPMTSTLGFAVRPRPFNAIFRPRGPWVQNIIQKECSTHSVDLASMLNRAAAEKIVKA
ncbi:hypothetical protein SCARD494_04586 [Seiridium cardinale]